jgi:hypothetical protein
MILWTVLVIGSALCGVACSIRLSGRSGLVASAVLPWSAVLAWVLYQEFAVPYRGGGASMWLVALLFAGAIAACAGVAAYSLCKRLFSGVV